MTGVKIVSTKISQLERDINDALRSIEAEYKNRAMVLTDIKLVEDFNGLFTAMIIYEYVL